MFARTARRSLVLLKGLVVIVLVLPAMAHADAPERPVTNWVRHHSSVLDSVDPTADLDDLAPVRASIGDADIVGLGEAVHGASELITLRHRALRFLVEEMGFRSIAWEDDWTIGIRINDYIRTGAGDLDMLMGEMTPQWQSREVRDVLQWLRSYNATHADQVQFVGVEHYLTWRPAYDAVEDYVARVAPDRLDELHRHFELIRPRPTTSTIWDHIDWYVDDVADKDPLVGAAAAVHELVEQSCDAARCADDRELALHSARQIVSFYVHYSLAFDDQLTYREIRSAENVSWWRDYTGDKVIYWAASVHTANAPELRIETPDDTWEFASTGSYLRRWHGERYLSVGFTLDHGTVSLEAGETATLPPPEDGWFERPFAGVDHNQFIIDLRHAAPTPVQRWLDGPIRTRGLADSGPGSSMSGGSLAQWFDVVVHRQLVTPTGIVAGTTRGDCNEG